MITAIIPTWNRRDLVESLLAGLARQSRPPGEILVVDNGSTDGTAEAARTAGARVLRLERNLGFAPAVNAGLRATATEWVVILNNDVELEPRFLETLYDTAHREGAWFGCGKLLSADGSRIDAAFDLLSRSGCAWRAGHGRPDSPVWNKQRRVWFAPMTAMLARRALFDKAGLLDETFESYLEDVEFGLRCALAGRWGIYVPEARGRHLGSATLGEWNPETVQRIARNQVLLVARHYPRRWKWDYGWPLLMGSLLWGAVAVRHGAGRAWLRGKWEGVRQFRGARGSGARSRAVSNILMDSEKELHELQRQTGYDLFWRLYFALT